MTKFELISRLCDDDEEEEVYIRIDGTLYEFTCEHVDEQFDGFDTAYPACIALVPKMDG